MDRVWALQRGTVFGGQVDLYVSIRRLSHAVQKLD
jgi:hypothetical protein